jgi:predicted nucleic acid-binding Zn ribbon protein
MIFKRHECEKCGKKFRMVEELMHHQLIAHESRLYTCEKCGMGFEGMEQMRDHARKFHSYNKQVDERKRSDGL